VQAHTSAATHPITVQPKKALSTKIAAAFLWRIPTSEGTKYIKMLKIIRTVRMDIPPAAPAAADIGEGIGVGVKMGLINSKSNSYNSFQNGFQGCQSHSCRPCSADGGVLLCATLIECEVAA
jgi:hypothetical protein